MDTIKENINKPANKILLITILVAAVLLIGLWIWKAVQISNVRKQAATEIEQNNVQVKKQIRISEELHLKSLAKPLVWAVRTEMLKNNIAQVNLYVNELVKEKNFQKVMVTNEKGMVILSTNKKDEGKEFNVVSKAGTLSADTTAINNINDSLLIMSTPVMGFNNRLGTIIVTYALQHPVFK